MPAPFPTTPILDDFNRADGAVGANWVDNSFGDPGTFTIGTNQIVPGSASGSSIAWATTVGPDCEVYFDVPTAGTNIIWVEIRATNTTGTWSGYQLQATPSGLWRIFRSDAGVNTQLGANASQAFASGDSIGLRAVGYVIEMWWKPSAGSWTFVDLRTDATYGAAGFIGFESAQVTQRLDNVGGGTASIGANRPTPPVHLPF